jgi:hypothetical protein
MTLKRIGAISYEMMLCAMLFGCIGGVGAFFEEMSVQRIVLYPAAAVLIVLLLLFCEAFLEMDGKMEQLKAMLIDYLENTMDSRRKYAASRTRETDRGEQTSAAAPTVAAAPAAGEVTVALDWESPEEERLVKEVLDEYLG